MDPGGRAPAISGASLELLVQASLFDLTADSAALLRIAAADTAAAGVPKNAAPLWPVLPKHPPAQPGTGWNSTDVPWRGRARTPT